MRKVDIAIAVMIIFVVAMIIGLYFFITGNSKDCLANPITYFEEKEDADCTCFSEDGLRYDFKRRERMVEEVMKTEYADG